MVSSHPTAVSKTKQTLAMWEIPKNVKAQLDVQDCMSVQAKEAIILFFYE